MEESRLSKLFKQDNFLKILSVFIAIILWANVSFVLNPETTREFTNIPVKINDYSLANSGLTVIDREYFVSFEVKGLRSVVASIDKNRLVGIADMAGYNKIGKNLVNIKINGLPSSVEITREPEDIYVEIDKLSSVTKKISYSPIGEVAKGYAALTPEITPYEVKITGPKKILQSIYDVRLIIDISNLENKFSGREKIRIIDTKGNEIKDLKCDPELAEINIPVVKTKEVPLVVDLKGEPYQNYNVDKVTLTPDKVLVYGKDEVIKQVNEIKLDSVDISNLSSNISKQVKIPILDNFNVVDGNKPVTLEIQVYKNITKTFVVPASQIKIKDKNGSLMYKISEDRASVVLSGRDSLVSSLLSDDLTVSISVDKLGEGQYLVPMNIVLPEGLKLNRADSVNLLVSKQANQ